MEHIYNSCDDTEVSNGHVDIQKLAYPARGNGMNHNVVVQMRFGAESGGAT